MSKQAKKTIKGWAIGLLNAALAGTFMLIVEPTSIFNDPKHALKLSAAGVAVAVYNYVQKSPIPTGEDDIGEAN